MQAAYPPAQHLDARFSGTNRIEVRRAELVSLDEARGRAMVAVDLLESQAGSHPRKVTVRGHPDLESLRLMKLFGHHQALSRSRRSAGVQP